MAMSWEAFIRRPSFELIGSAFVSSRHWSARMGCITVNIGHRSVALTTWIVMRMSELRTTPRRWRALARLATRAFAARAASANGGHSGCCAWSEPRRSTAAAAPRAVIGSSSPWRARVARFSSRAVIGAMPGP
jgi:hypothetical protein